MSEEQTNNEPKAPPLYSRLYIGSLIPATTDADVRELLKPFGVKVVDMYLNAPKGFAFAKLEGKESAVRVAAKLNGSKFKGRVLRATRAYNNASLWVGDLNPYVTNELLFEAFSQFGQVERAIVSTDDKGFSNTWGKVEFAKKRDALRALKSCEDGWILLTRSWKPVRVATYVHRDEDEEGFKYERMRETPLSHAELSTHVRFAKGMPESLEFEYAQKWMSLFAREKNRKAALREELREERMALEKDMKTVMVEEERRRKTMHMQRSQEAERMDMEARQEAERWERERRWAMEQKMYGLPQNQNPYMNDRPHSQHDHGHNAPPHHEPHQDHRGPEGHERPPPRQRPPFGNRPDHPPHHDHPGPQHHHPAQHHPGPPHNPRYDHPGSHQFKRGHENPHHEEQHKRGRRF